MKDRYAALVKGPSVLFPRGFLWLIPVWYTAIAVALRLKGKTPPWYGDAALGGLALASLTLLCVLVTVRNNAFLADESGIWLGLRAGATRRLGRRRRQIKQLPWAQIEQVQIFPRSYGTRLEVILNEAAPIVGWPGALRRIANAVLLLIIPISYVVRTPALLSPSSDPPSYRIPLYDVTVAELRLALAQLAPAAVPIVEMPRWRARPIGRQRPARTRPSYRPPASLAPRPPAAVTSPPPAVTSRPTAASAPPAAVAVPPPAAVAVPAAAAAPPAPADDQQEVRGHMIA